MNCPRPIRINHQPSAATWGRRSGAVSGSKAGALSGLGGAGRVILMAGFLMSPLAAQDAPDDPPASALPPAVSEESTTEAKKVERNLEELHEQKDIEVPKRVLRVGIADNPPYALKTVGGKWDGIAVDLWDLLAARLDLEYEYVEVSRRDMLRMIADGELDLAVGEVPITADRARIVDFTHPYFTSRLALAFEQGGWKPDWARLARDIFNRSLFFVLGAVFLTLFVVSFLFYAFEGRKNPHYRRKGLRGGLVSGIWYATATLTTVGTGSDEPRTIAGTLLGLFWMTMSVVLVGAVSASVAASVASASLRDARTVSDELERSVNGVVSDSLAEQVMKTRHYYFRSFESIEDAMRALNRRRTDTVVAGWVSLTYLNEVFYDGKFQVVQTDVASYEYGIPLPRNSDLREPLNIAILEVTGTPEWRTNLVGWLGADAARRFVR